MICENMRIMKSHTQCLCIKAMWFKNALHANHASNLFIYYLINNFSLRFTIVFILQKFRGATILLSEGEIICPTIHYYNFNHDY